MIPVYIPSMGRADKRLSLGPAAQMPEDWLVNYVVPPAEEAKYRSALAARGLSRVGVMAAHDVSGIANTRLFIGKFAKRVGQPKFVMMDDDIKFYVRKSPDAFNLRYTKPEEVGEALTWIEISLDDHAHVSLSAREGNNRADAGERVALTVNNTRTLRVLAYRTEEFLATEHGRVPVMEDFDVNLQLLRRGLSNAVSFWWAQGQRQTNEAGGCSTYRTHELHEAAARKLADLHPGFVRLRQKENKSGGAFGHRTEVTIAWKKAFDAARSGSVGTDGFDPDPSTRGSPDPV